MKHCTLLMTLAVCLLLPSCKESEEKPYEGQNKIVATFTSGTSLSTTIKGVNKTLKINVKLTSILKQDVHLIVEATPKEEANKYLSLPPEGLTIRAGEREGEIMIQTTLTSPKTDQDISIIIKPTGDYPKTVIASSPITLRINPSLLIDLTDKQKDLIQGYIKKYNLDISPLLGTWICSGIVKEHGQGTNSYFQKERDYIIKDQETTITLSPLATEERPILAMPSNAFGLADIKGEEYQRQTIKDNEYWYYIEDPSLVPYSPKMMELIGWTMTSKETYDVGYYTLEIDPATGGLKTDFLLPIKEILKLPNVAKENLDENFVIYTSDEPGKLYPPFVFDFSPWNRLIEAKQKGETPDLNEWVIAGNVSPYQLLYATTSSEDKWTEELDLPEQSYFIAPSLTMDKETKAIHLVVSWDHAKSECYTNFDITCTKAED